MGIDRDTSLRDLLQPQDALAGLITFLGVLIAIFLPDAIVKLIGACIGVLGGVALYMTLRGRAHDQVQIRKKRTTLPTPAFKTHVTTDPATSAKRIRFDDFQETFHVDEEAGAESPPAPRPKPAPPGTTVRFDDFTDDVADAPSTRVNADWENAELDVNTGDGEGFRIVPASSEKKSEPAPTPKVAAPTPEATTAPPAESREETSDRKSNAAERRKKKRGKKKRGGAGDTQQQTTPPKSAASTPAATAPPIPEPAEEAIPAESTPAVESTPVAEGSAVPPKPASQAVRRQIQTVLNELTPESEEKEGEPRADFVRLVNQILKAIARSIDGRSIIFFWMNLERGHFIPEACVTRGEVGVRLGERIKLSNDLISQIARGGVPEIITNISPAAENELAPYYREKTGTRSFVGVPVFFRQEVVGVLAADSADESGFDEASVATLAEYTILISQLIRDYAEKFDLYLMRRSIEAFEKLNVSLTGSDMRPREIARFLVAQVTDLFDLNWAGVILYNKTEERWWMPAVEGDDKTVVGRLKHLQPDMGTSIAGEAARSATEIYLSEIAGETLIAPGEDLGTGGSFLAVPLMASSKCYGSLVLGNDRPNAWVTRDVELLRDLARYVAMAIEVVNTNEALAEHQIYDEQTGLYNSDFFMGGFGREIERAHDFKLPLSLALIRVETPEGFAPKRRSEVSHLSVAEIGSTLARKIRPYDLIGRFDDQTFGVALVGKSDQEAYLWAERFRKEVAGHIIPFDSRTFSVTVSAGVCNATDTSDKASIIDGAEQALEKALKGGGNSVVIY